jgi:WD40 repeat protein
MRVCKRSFVGAAVVWMAALPAFGQKTPEESFPDGVRFVLEEAASGGPKGGAIHYSPNGRMLLLHGRRGWGLREPEDGTEVRRLKVPSDSSFLGWSPDSKRLAFSDFSRRRGRRLVLVDAASGKECWRAEEPLADGAFFLFTPDSKSVAFVRRGDLVRRDAATGKQLQQFRPKHLWGLTAFSPDLRRACSFETLGRDIIHLWDVESKKELWQTPLTTVRIGHTFHSVFRFTPDGRRLIASASWHGVDPDLDRTVVLDVASGKKLWGFRQGSYPILSPNGRYLVVGEELGGQWVDVVSGEVKANFARAISGFFHPRAVFSADSRLMTYRPEGDVVQLFETSTAGLIATYRRPGESVRQVAFAPGGRTLAISYSDASVVFHDLTGRGKATARIKRSPEELDRLWADLGRGPVQGQRALWQLARSPGQAVALIRARIPPPRKVDAAAIAKLVGQLDDEEFGVRESAQKELAGLGLRAVPALKTALKKRPSPEARRRMERLLAAQGKLALREQPARHRRAVAVLEAVGDEAAALLKEYAGGPEEDPLAVEARAALKRLRVERAK